MKVCKVSNRPLSVGTDDEFAASARKIKELPRRHLQPDSAGAVDRDGGGKAAGKTIAAADQLTSVITDKKEASRAGDPQCPVAILDCRTCQKSWRAAIA